MAQLTNLDRILQREERTARLAIERHEVAINSLNFDLEAERESLAFQREVHRDVIEAMVARDVPIYEGGRR